MSCNSKHLLNWIYLFTACKDDEVSKQIQKKFKESETCCSV
ncbi:hypothetical protein QIT55_gp02 [Nitrosopumilus spindle-shaped virus]|uniref:Uncharacterized protein n=1 Tax=Nitrosopumilus spindle-shaped virus 1 TaxID=2848002 RepID=A0A514K539_9VIRU|nr:hypothetical protein QIT55_gp02 [Nitrosopumilus spindle-shaped virus]QDI73988.1 hypothetical protein [Nitrosopumilus spindle-shaped virus]